ncbi:MAG: hypothetical protein JXR03_13990 [Cyclobacteriaceae bacterium]
MSSRKLTIISFVFLTSCFFITHGISAQNAMGVGTDTPNQNAVLELVSPTSDQGFLVPRYTTAQRTATSFTSKLAAIDNGLMVFDSDEGQFYFWFGGVWQQVTNVSSGGDMATSTYDTNSDGTVDDASLVNGLSVETAVPVGAVFTDDQTAGTVAVTATGNLVSTDVQAALEELQSDIDSDLGGDMQQSVFDVNSDNVIDTVANAGFVNGFTVESAVPASAVFTDNQTAAEVEVTATGNLASTDVQAALEELQSEIDSDLGGDMLGSVYDTNSDNVIDTVTNAGFVNGLTVETAVPASAVFTDEQTAADVEVTPSGNLAATEVQAALEELQGDIDATAASPWTDTAGDLTYDLGNVGVGTTNPVSRFQVHDRLHINRFVNSGFDILDAYFIGHNAYVEESDIIGDSLYTNETATSSMIFFNQGQIEFLHSDTLAAGTNLAENESLGTSLTLKKSRDAEFRGAVEVGRLRDSTNFSSGTLSYGNGGFFGYNGVDWINLGGLSFPSQNIIDESGSTPLYIENTGTAGVARFQVNNPSTFASAVDIINNSDDINSAGLVINHDGLGPGAEILLNDGTNAERAFYSKTVGTGSAGRFEIENGTNNSAALYGGIITGTGIAVQGYTSGTGQAARFTIDNASNGSIAMSVRSDGTNSTALFENTNSSAITPTVEISNNGTGAGLTIQNPGGTTSFGDISFINGDLGIGQFSPSAKLDVVGDTELNGDAVISGNLTNSGAVIHSGTNIVNNSDYVIQNTDYIINLNGTGFQSFTINLPKANDAAGRELIFVVQGTQIHYDIVLEAGDNFARNNGVINTTNLLMSQYAFGEWYFLTIKSVGNIWYVTSFLVNGAA